MPQDKRADSRKATAEKPVSLSPLTLDEALQAMIGIRVTKDDPAERKPNVKRRKK